MAQRLASLVQRLAQPGIPARRSSQAWTRVLGRPSCLLHHAASIEDLHLSGVPAVWHHLCDLTYCRRRHATPGSGLLFEAPPEAASLSARAVLEQAARRRRAAAAKYDGVQFGVAPGGGTTCWEQGSILNTTADYSDLVGTCSSGVQQASPPRDRWWPDDEKASR